MTAMSNAGMPATTMAYDIANRMVESVHNTAGTYRFGYNHANQRVIQYTSTTAFGTRNRRFRLYGFAGELLLEANRTESGVQPHTGEFVRYVYFLGRKMFASLNRGPLKAAVPNRLGSRSDHFPYGELKGASPPEGDKDNFTTYRRDANGQDYAWNRYYAPSVGRFTTADPYGGSANPQRPDTWNAYQYVSSDPVNLDDPTGQSHPVQLCAWGDIGCILGSLGYGPQLGGPGVGPSPQWNPCVTPQGPHYSAWQNPAWCILPPILVTAAQQGLEPYTPLVCNFVETIIDEPGFGFVGSSTFEGFYNPITFVFSANGGRLYQWHNSQIVNRSGIVTYSDGTVVNLSNATDFPTRRESLRNTASSPVGPVAAYFDAPGLQRQNFQGALVVVASILWSFELTVSVSSGSRRANCGTVRWTVVQTWNMINGEQVVSGSTTVYSRGLNVGGNRARGEGRRRR